MWRYASNIGKYSRTFWSVIILEMEWCQRSENNARNTQSEVCYFFQRWFIQKFSKICILFICIKSKFFNKFIVAANIMNLCVHVIKCKMVELRKMFVIVFWCVYCCYGSYVTNPVPLETLPSWSERYVKS